MNNIMRRVASIAAVVVLAGSSACSSARVPDLAWVYRPLAQQAKTVPLVVVPGIMGSRLAGASDGREIWPGSTWDVLTGRRFGDLALGLPGSETIASAPSPPQLRAGGIFHEIVGTDFYSQLIETLDGPAGYHCQTLAEIGPDTDCVLFAWDWRRGMVEAAAELDRLIERLRVLKGRPDLRVDVVAHSAGGLVARYFVRFGSRDVLDESRPQVDMAGGDKVRQAILIGTPNYGSVSALQQAIMGEKVGFVWIQPETMATMPGMYQLLPHPDRTWMIDVSGQRLDIDLYDVDTWRKYAWSIFDPDVRTRVVGALESNADRERYLEIFDAYFGEQLLRARHFHRALSLPIADSPTRYVVFGSACTPTPARCLIEQVDGRARVRLRPRDIRYPRADVDYEQLMVRPGDGSVTKASLLARDSLDSGDFPTSDFPMAYTVFVCDHHAQLAGNVTFRDNLLNIISFPQRAPDRGAEGPRP